MQKKNRVNILGVPVDMVDKEQASAVFAEIFPQPGCSMIVTPNSEIVQNASKDEELRSLIASCLLYTSPSPRDVEESRMPSSA